MRTLSSAMNKIRSVIKSHNDRWKRTKVMGLSYLTQRLAILEEEFDIQKILDAGHLLVDCLPAFLGFHEFLEADL
jgi:hypothetical protein